GELGGRVDLFEVEQHRLPAGQRLGHHLVEDARLADPSLGLHPNAVAVQHAPQVRDEPVAAEDVLDGQLSTWGRFHRNLRVWQPRCTMLELYVEFFVYQDVASIYADFMSEVLG